MASRRTAKHALQSGIRAECFILCDVARVEGGKLYVLGGGWDRITPDQLPMPYSFQIAAKLVVPRKEAVLPLELQVGVQEWPELAVEAKIPRIRVVLEDLADDALDFVSLLLPLGMDVTFTLPGKYRLHLTINGQIIAETEFEVLAPRAGSTSDADVDEAASDGPPLLTE